MISPMDDASAPTAANTPAPGLLRFSLKSLLALVVIVGVPLGWLASELQEIRKEHLAVRELRRLGVDCDVYHGGPGPGEAIAAKIWGEPVAVPIAVSLDGQPLSEEILTQIAALTHVERLDLGESGLSDRDLARIAHLANVEMLNADSTALTDAGLAHLIGWNNLRTLYLQDTAITDAGIEQLQRLTGLVSLDLRDTNISDAGLAPIGRMTS